MHAGCDAVGECGTIDVGAWPYGNAMDRMSKETRSQLMSRIRSKDTGIEVALRKELYRRGCRYRIHYGQVPGKPDIAFVTKKVAVFCDSEFWHGYRWADNRDRIKSNRRYWTRKIERNMRRDREIDEALQRQGWAVIRFWGKDILKDPGACADKVEDLLIKR